MRSTNSLPRSHDLRPTSLMTEQKAFIGELQPPNVPHIFSEKCW